jgi:UDP-3-O-[3-hydroxymyristoyl] N-acetylglucosamine deacetylase
MEYRQTLKAAVPVEGIGLHSGAPVRGRLVPADPGSGIVFVRTDQNDYELPATLELLGPSFYATVLERDDIRLTTVEHLMSALLASHVDDLRIEIDGPEVPILDGSAAPFLKMIADVGLETSSMPREYLSITRPIEVKEDEKSVAVYPHSGLRITYAIEFDHPRLGYQELTVSLWDSKSFEQKLSGARTFTFERDVEALRRAGLALGGSLDNAVVLGEKDILNDSLRYPDEFVRHKMLDLVGDLALLGRPLRGHVVAYRAGHHMHTRLARKISESTGSWHLDRAANAAPSGPAL